MNEEELDKTIIIESLEDLKTDNSTKKEEANKNYKQNNLEKKPSNRNVFFKIKKWWRTLSKKKKIFLIIINLILLIIVGLIIFLVIKKNKSEIVKEIKKEDVILVQENYRYENGNLIFLNNKNEEIGMYECVNKDETKCFVAHYSAEDEFDIEKETLEDGSPILKRTPIINNNYVFVNDTKSNEEQIKIYNIKTKKINEEIYRLVKPANKDNTSFILKNNLGNYGIINFNNEIKEKIPFNYDYLGFIPSILNKYISKINNRYLVIDESGKTISKGLSGQVKYLNDNYIKILKDNKKYAVYDYNGHEIFNNYDYVELFDEYAAVINNNKMILKFYDNNKLNEEEIVLDNSNYVSTKIYDKENNLKEEKKSFKIEEKNNLINIKIFKNNDLNKITLNKLEALKSKTIPFVNYFNGKLYFYQDNQKNVLLGSYKCNNKNLLKKENDSLDNCFIASNTIFETNDLEAKEGKGLIPIINSRYVFILDKAKNKTIAFYDLKNSKTISKYHDVNTYIYTNEEIPTHNNHNLVNIVAKNKNNQFGVIKIINNEIMSHIKFDYEYIEKIGEFYSVKNDKGYLLLKIDNAEPLFNKPVKGKITNYNENYLTGVEENLYYVYNKDSQKINNTGANYIALYEYFFGAVDKENKLGLYLYNKPQDNFLETEVKLKINKYYGNDPLAFKVDVLGKTYQVLVGDSKHYENVTSGIIPLGEE